MEDKLFYDDDLMKFFDVLWTEVKDIDKCEECVKEAILVIADRTRLGKAEICLDAPPTKFRPNGQYHNTVLYDRKQEVCTNAYVLNYTLPDGGSVTITLRAYGEEDFSEDEKKNLKYIFGEVFYKFNRTMMQGILINILDTDVATTVASPEAFMRFVERTMRAGQLNRYVVLFVNIHNFKYVNKVFPYEEGDVILKNYACTIKNMLYEDEIVARLGGDNFVLLVNRDRYEYMVENIQNIHIYHSAGAKEKHFLFSATIGASGLENISVSREVMARASIAYQTARLKSVGSVVFYSDEIQQRLMENQSIISDFGPALDNGEFVVYYQPKVDAFTKEICGAEALIRWMRNGKLIYPNSFIPQLENEGSICRLDYFVLESVCKFLRNRKEQGLNLINISVNFSRRHMEEDDLVQNIVRTIDRYGVDHQYIEIELTESGDFQNYEIMSGIVNGLRDNGIRTSVDDFGTGFSSLNMIKNIDLNIIKIDKSFIPLENDYTDKDRDKIMFGNIINMVKQLGKKTVAEGVETASQYEYLKSVGCDMIQGYLFDKPLTENDFKERLSAGYR